MKQEINGVMCNFIENSNIVEIEGNQLCIHNMIWSEIENTHIAEVLLYMETMKPIEKVKPKKKRKGGMNNG